MCLVAWSILCPSAPKRLAAEGMCSPWREKFDCGGSVMVPVLSGRVRWPQQSENPRWNPKGVSKEAEGFSCNIPSTCDNQACMYL